MSEFKRLREDGLIPDVDGEWTECADSELQDALQDEEVQALAAVACEPAPEDWPPTDKDGNAIIADE